jgi:exodeoxyribonuclease VII small subunit
MSEPRPITFENGYRRLQEIAEQVNHGEVSVDRLAGLFAEAKGLDKTLTDHLGEQRARIEKIERGEEVQAFKIVSPDEQSAAPSASDVPAATGEFAPAAAGGAADDDIPF